MADQWNTYAFEFTGGLVSNISPLQQGIKLPGSARVLRNFEPSIEGGYKRILGYTKFDDELVPSNSGVKVHGSSQTGTTLIVGNIFAAPPAGATLTITGVTGTYTIASGGVSYDNANKRATLTLTQSLASSPADKANVTFTYNSGLINGVAAWEGKVLAVKNNSTFYSTGNGWVKANVPNYGTVLVNGGSQTGSSLIVDGLTEKPAAGDTFTINGVNLIYTVTASTTPSSGGATLTINPALASSPADNAAITFLTANRTSSNKNRFAKYRIGAVEKIAGVDGTNTPFTWDFTSFVPLNSAPADVVGATHIAFFKNQMFYGKGTSLTFTAPYTDNDFNTANGAGVINLSAEITGLIVFREQLIIFTQRTISRLVGNTISDFQLQPITDNIGCIDTDTIQEFGSDVMFLGPDGLRLLSATDRIGDFGLAVVSKTIQKEITDLISASSSFSSIVIKEKSQYRLFGFNSSFSEENALGVLGTQLSGEQGGAIGWAELRGFNAYVADSNYVDRAEVIVFANGTGYVYQMESGSSFDGSNILATFSTPFVPVNDPRIRKSFYKLFLYVNPVGSVSVDLNLKLDFDDEGLIQPETITLSNSNAAAGFYGAPTSVYGTTVFGGKLKRQFETQVIGSGFTVSLQIASDGTDPPFSLDAATLEFASHDRR